MRETMKYCREATSKINALNFIYTGDKIHPIKLLVISKIFCTFAPVFSASSF